MATYIAVLEKEADTDYGVWFPDFPGCITAGSTPGEAVAMAHEALQFHIDGMIEDGEEIPEPAGWDAVVAEHEQAAGVHLFPVETKVPGDKAVRINITLPERVIYAVDKVSGGNRSGFLADAAMEKIAGGRLAVVRDDTSRTTAIARRTVNKGKKEPGQGKHGAKNKKRA